MREFKVRFGGDYDTRITKTTSITSSGYVGIGKVGLMVVGKTNAITTKDQRYVNCFVESVAGEDGRARRFLVKRPGWETSITPAAGQVGEHIIIWTGKQQKIISSFGETNSTVYDSTTSLGAITGETTGLTETHVSNNPVILATSSDSTAWYYDAGVSVVVMTKITDADFPGNAGKTLAGTFVHMDGYAVIMCTDGTIWASDLNSITAWTATSFDTANAYPDRGIGLARHKNMILAFGTESVQFYQNAGLTPFPFAKIPSMTLKVGAISADCITQLSDNIYFCGSTPQGGLSVFQYSENGITRISPPAIDNALLIAQPSNLSMTSVRFFGRSFIIVNTATQSYVFCIEEKSWHEWTGTNILWSKCAGTSTGTTMVNYGISHISTSGKIYVMNNASFVFTDDGVAYTALAQPHSDNHGTTKRKFYSEIEIIGDTETESSPVTLMYSDDDYQTYTTWGTLDLSTTNPKATRLGASNKRAWALSHSANTPMRIEYLQGKMEIGK